MLFLASWLQGDFVAAIVGVYFSVVHRWPFVGVIYFSFGIHMLITRSGKGASGVLSLTVQEPLYCCVMRPLLPLWIS